MCCVFVQNSAHMHAYQLARPVATCSQVSFKPIGPSKDQVTF